MMGNKTFERQAADYSHPGWPRLCDLVKHATTTKGYRSLRSTPRDSWFAQALEVCVSRDTKRPVEYEKERHKEQDKYTRKSVRVVQRCTGCLMLLVDFSPQTTTTYV